jgi:hypothetical protein
MLGGEKFAFLHVALFANVTNPSSLLLLSSLLVVVVVVMMGMLSLLLTLLSSLLLALLLAAGVFVAVKSLGMAPASLSSSMAS